MSLIDSAVVRDLKERNKPKLKTLITPKKWKKQQRELGLFFRCPGFTAKISMKQCIHLRKGSESYRCPDCCKEKREKRERRLMSCGGLSTV
jgi:hypothetical protein